MKFFEGIRQDFLSTRTMEDLPDRVRETLRRREWINEIVVRVIQLTIVVMFLILYSLSTKTSQGADFQPVPYVLGAYVILSIIGLLWSIRSPLPNWAVYCSILFDFMLLYTLLVSFHYQYEQPASFILKTPTLLYVFIFIALRALRLEWKFVAASGLVAAAGWLTIVLYVIKFDLNNPMITRSYVDYLTSNSILIGAEIDKIISILAVTGILALVVNSSSNLLVTAVTEQSAARDFSRFFDKQIAEGIRSSGGKLAAGQGERRTMAIINIDIRGFTTITANREASEIMQMLSDYQSRVVPILQKHGAVIDKFMGDGIMATVGAEENVKNFARVSLEAVEEILRDSENWQSKSRLLASAGPLKIGIGVAAGTVAFGAVGQNDRLEMTVIGAPVNTSAKLEKHNKVLGTRCIVQREIWQQAVQNGYTGSLTAEFQSSNIEGIEEPQEIAVLSLPIQ